MPKFEMKVLAPGIMLENGNYRDAKVALIPVNDAAMVSPRAKDALASGAWIPTEKDAIKKAADRLAEAHAVADIKRGVVAPDQKEERKAQLLKSVFKI